MLAGARPVRTWAFLTNVKTYLDANYAQVKFDGDYTSLHVEAAVLAEQEAT